MRFHFALAASIAITAPAFADDSRATTYCLYEIVPPRGLPAGGLSMQVTGINDRDQVTGWISREDGSPFHAFIWDRRSGARDLGAVPGHASVTAAAINDAGTVVGDASDLDTGESLAFAWTPRRGGRSLDTSLGGVDSFATAINRRGQIAGGSATASGDIHAFVRDVDGDVLDLGTFPDGTGFSSATAMNDRGQVIGTRSDGAEREDVFVWDARHGMQSLSPQFGPGFPAFPSAINNRGEVVGSAIAGDTQIAFRWTRSGGVQFLGTLSGVGTDFATASAINDGGTIVGGSQTATGEFHGFVWNARTGMRDLNELVDGRSPVPVRPVLGTAMGINEEGAIAVSGLLPGEGEQRGYLMAPRKNHREGCQ